MPISKDVKLGQNVKIFHEQLVNLYGCSVGDDTKIGTFVEVQADAHVGAKCKISSHTFICEGVTIEDEVFIGHGVMFINDIYPRSTTDDGEMQIGNDWEMAKTLIKRRASIGSNATIMGGITIGENTMIGAGAVVVHDVPDNAVVAGVPARMTSEIRKGNKNS